MEPLRQELERGPVHERAGQTNRRAFLKWSGVAAGALLVTGCDDIFGNDDGNEAGEVVIDLSNDFGVLNFAYALEQLEAAFYTQVASSFYAGATADERAVLTDLRDHEIAHREFFRVALGNNAIGALTPDFSTINFGNRDSVLQTARTFENVGVFAYNGAGQYLQSRDFLTIAGKIVSVEARHAAAIQDLISPRTFVAEIGDGFDEALTPTQVLAAVDPFITTRITLRNAPA